MCLMEPLYDHMYVQMQSWFATTSKLYAYVWGCDKRMFIEKNATTFFIGECGSSA